MPENDFQELPDAVNEFLNDVSEETEYKEPPVIEPEEIEETSEIATEPKAEKPSINPRLQAQFYCTMFDTTLRTGFGFAHRNKLKKKLGPTKVDDAFQKWTDFKDGALSKEELTDQSKKDINKVDKFVKNYEKLPLTEDEKEMFISSLSEIITENDYKMPPSLGIALVMFNATFTRTMDYLFE